MKHRFTLLLSFLSCLIFSTQNLDAQCDAAAIGGTLTCLTPTIQLNGNSTIPGVTFAWTGPGGFTSTLENPTVDAAGNYTLTVTNPADGCTATAVAAVNLDVVPPQISATASNGGFLTCIEPTIELFGNSTTPGATFVWSGPSGFFSTNSIITASQPGVYTLVATSPNGCTNSTVVTVVVDSSIPTWTCNINQAPCSLGNLVCSGQANYQYQWSNGQTGSTIGGLNFGTYCVTVTDPTNGCTATQCYTITQPPQMVFSPAITNDDCAPGGQGAIQLQVAGGTPPYTFGWSTGHTIQNISGLVAGVYSVTIIDANGCSSVGTYNVGGPTFLNFIMTLGCTNDPKDVSANLIGGVAPVSISVFGPVSTSATITSPGGSTVFENLSPGTYQITSTDATGCISEQTLNIPTVDELQVELVLSGNGCNGGLVSVNVTGASVFPLLYQWTPSNFLPTLAINQSGTYSVTVTDANGCSASDTEFFDILDGNCGTIQGKIFNDDDFNCLNANDLGLIGWLVQAVGQDTFYAVSDSQGFFEMRVFPGNYELSAVLPGASWALCQPLPMVAVAASDDTVSQNIGVQPIIDCPEMSVEITAGALRRCFSTNSMLIKYCNNGTVSASDAYIEMTLDPLLTPLGTSYPYTPLGNDVYRFNLGTVESGNCGTIWLNFKVSCDAVLGQTLCYSAHIFPDTPCLQSQFWTGAHLDLAANCSTDSLRFVLKNTGTGDMNSTLEYVVIEDGVMLRTGSQPGLSEGEEMTVSVPTNGSTWRIEAEQEIHHPGNSMPSLTVEGCTTNASFSTGYVNLFPQNDADPQISEECKPVVGSYDPNDKTGFPLGFGNQHFIRPGTDIEYQIRFQNTGTDTAFTVVIRDTISQFLNPASIREPIASHPFSMEIYGEGILKFTFDNILLPDSNVNEAASHGFVKFRISQRPGVPLETDIFNSAAIYFDFNEPVITNTTVHRVGENFIPVKTWFPAKPDFEISAMPNPFADVTLLKIKGLSSGEEISLKIFDLRGNLLREENGAAPNFFLKREGLPDGAYFLKIETAGGVFGLGKIVVE